MFTLLLYKFISTKVGASSSYTTKGPFRKKFTTIPDLNKTFSKRSSLAFSNQSEIDLDKSTHSFHKPARTTFPSRKNIALNKYENIEKVVEEANNSMVDEKVKKIIKMQKTNLNTGKNKKGSLLSLLKFSIMANTLLIKSDEFNLCKEYMKSIDKKI